MSDPVKVVKDFVAAVTAGDMVAATGMLSEDFALYHFTRLPYRGDYHSRAGFGDLLMHMAAFWESFEPTPGQQIIRDGEGVVVIGKLRGKPKHIDEEIAIHVLERYSLKGSEITTIWTLYIDTHLTQEQVTP